MRKTLDWLDIHGLAAMILKAKPDLNIARAATAVMTTAAPVYLKLELRYSRSATLRGALVSRLNTASMITTAPATLAYKNRPLSSI